VSASTTARKATNLASQPPSGGMPASENRNTDISTASDGA
jgi:hypothetical protein